MTNTRNTPVESIAHELPFRVARYRLRRDSGGAGERCGGEGIERVLEATGELELSLLSERRTTAPYGLAGGEPGAPSRVQIERADGGREELEPRATTVLVAGDRLVIFTPGGGGHGPPAA
jgi:N-methylhydantoinase B/oxoprolinase/acetone carboxylase alpha subunit